MIQRLLQPKLEELMRRQLDGGSGHPVDFSKPEGEPALVAADSVSWKVFANPVTLVIGGISAVILELAEPSIRSGVWDHTTFRTDPMTRMRRTGLAAMITVYGARSQAQRMIQGVRRMHEKVQGTTPDGIPYRADDPDLLRWVHATAAFGFLNAYHRHVAPLADEQRNQYYAEGVPVSLLYGSATPPASEVALDSLMAEMKPRLGPSEVLNEFLSIMQDLPLVPKPFRPLNRLFIHAAIDLIPPALRDQLELKSKAPFPGCDAMLNFMARKAEHLELASSPRHQARLRLGVATK